MLRLTRESVGDAQVSSITTHATSHSHHPGTIARGGDNARGNTLCSTRFVVADTAIETSC